MLNCVNLPSSLKHNNDSHSQRFHQKRQCVVYGETEMNPALLKALESDLSDFLFSDSKDGSAGKVCKLNV